MTLLPLISVIIPVYNNDSYLEECLTSVINQTYSNIEVITVDDGSEDESLFILEQFRSTDTRVKVLRQKHKGVSVARNAALDVATGKYILFVDSDDFIERDTIEKLVLLLERTNCDMVRFNGNVFIEEDVKVHNWMIDKRLYDFSHRLEHHAIYDKNVHEVNKKTFTASITMYMVKREIIETNNVRFVEGIIHEDDLFNTMLFISLNTMTYENCIYYHRRYRADSIMTANNSKQNIYSFQSYLKVMEEMKKMINRNDLSKPQKNLIKRQIISIYYSLKYNSKVSNEYKKEQLTKVELPFKDQLYVSLLRVRSFLKKERLNIKGKSNEES